MRKKSHSLGARAMIDAAVVVAAACDGCVRGVQLLSLSLSLAARFELRLARSARLGSARRWRPQSSFGFVCLIEQTKALAANDDDDDDKSQASLRPRRLLPLRPRV